MSGFDTTRWSIVRAAGSDSTGRARQALTQLCGTYWEPLYAYLARGSYFRRCCSSKTDPRRPLPTNPSTPNSVRRRPTKLVI